MGNYVEKVCFIVFLLLFTSPIVFAEIDQSQCVVEPKSQRLLYQSVAGVPKAFKPKPSRYVDSYTSVDVLIDVRQRFESPKPSTVQLKQALQLPLYSLKTKTYLKNRRIILVGTGFDDFFLEQEISILQELGFRSLKIMRFGIAALLGTDQLNDSPEVALKVRSASAEEIVSANLGKEQDFLFVNLGQPNTVYRTLGLQSMHLPFKDTNSFYQELFNVANRYFDQNNYIRIVLVHDDTEVHQTISQSKNMFNMSGLFFVKGGNQALIDLQKQLAKTAILSQKVKRHCGGE